MALIPVSYFRDLFTIIANWVTRENDEYLPQVEITRTVYVAPDCRRTAKAGVITVAHAGTPIDLDTPEGDIYCGAGFTFIAAPTNTGLVYIYPRNIDDSQGGIEVTTKNDVLPIAAGESVYWPIIHIGAVRYDASVDGQKIYWTGVD